LPQTRYAVVGLLVLLCSDTQSMFDTDHFEQLRMRFPYSPVAGVYTPNM